MRTEIQVKQGLAKMLAQAEQHKLSANQEYYDIVMGYLCGMCWTLGIPMSMMQSEEALFKICAELMT